MTINIHNMLQAALKQEEAEHAQGEVAKRGVLRAGNSGIILPSGVATGSCARLAHLRSRGIDSEDVGADRRIMFGGGISNEGYWHRQLSRTWGGPILREHEIPIQWTTSNGTRVSGRPDLVLCEVGEDTEYATPEGIPVTPVLGLELKMVSAFNTARVVLFNGKPKLNHLCQAGHYSWKLGVPFRLVYTSYVDFPIPAWGTQGLPKKATDPLAEFCQFNDRGSPKKVLPFVRVYELDWDGNGFLRYRVEGGGGSWTTSIVSQSAVENYYTVVAAMGPGKHLPPRPETLTATGDKEGYTICAYCQLNSACNETEYDRWMDTVKHLRGVED